MGKGHSKWGGGRPTKGMGWRERFGGTIGGSTSKLLLAIKIALALVALLLLAVPIILVILDYFGG